MWPSPEAHRGTQGREGTVTFKLTLDTSKFVKAMRELAQAVTRAATQNARFGRLLQQAPHIHRYGLDNLGPDGGWQTDLCAAWLHGSCQVPSVCDCTCHGGNLR